MNPESEVALVLMEGPARTALEAEPVLALFMEGITGTNWRLDWTLVWKN